MELTTKRCETGLINASGNAGFLQLVKSIGEDIAKSGMFGCETEAAGRVFALHCLVTRQDPLSIPQEYHLMQKKLSLRADAMLARLSRSGGNYEIVSHTPDCAEVTMEFRGRKIHQKLTWADAQNEPFVYEGKDKEIIPILASGDRTKLKLSVNYATPRKRMQMLWSRVISDGVRVVAPELVTGSYTAGEIADYSGVEYTEAEVVEAKTVAAATRTAVVLDTVEKQVADQPAKVNETKTTDGPSTPEQCQEITVLFDAMGVKEENRRASFAQRGATSAEGLTKSQAEEMLITMRARMAQVKATKPTEAEKTSINTEGPITQELYDQVVAKVKAVAQGPNSKLATRVSDHLVANKVRIGDLTFDQGRKLLKALDGIEIEEFFAMPICKSELVLDKTESQEAG
jgi:hypothetical protein